VECGGAGQGGRADGADVAPLRLHHYDELGLLRPSARTAAGHRRYTEGDLRRLYQIRQLRQLGMTLGEIGELLDGASGDGALRERLDRRLGEVDEEIWRLEELRRRIRNMVEQLDSSFRPTSGELLALLGRTSVFHDGLTREQRASLSELSEKLGEDGRAWLDTEWPLVLTRFAEHFRDRVPVEDPEVVSTVRRLVRVMELFAGDDPAVRASMAGFFREHGAAVLRDMDAGLEVGDGLWEYVGRALRAHQ
jgi:MerR family transcriptional regulator, thiopeptide resistance regulator